MKAVVLALAATVFASIAALGQGQFVFNNRVLPDINARFVLDSDPPGSSGIGTNYSVQLFNHDSSGNLTPLNPLATTFRGPANTPSAGYVVPTTETVPGLGPGQDAFVVLRVFCPSGYSTGEIGPYRLTLGGGTITPPNLPLGTSPLVVLCTVPEPSTAVLTLLGVALVILRQRSHSATL